MADNVTSIDSSLADNVTFTMGDTTKKTFVKIKFQFPPKILNDSRTGSWFETEVPGNQPIATWKTSGARKWTLEWTYVVGARGWTVNDVRTQITAMRAYWTQRENLATNFIVKFWIWKLGGPDLMTCRLTNIDITHGKAIYVPDGDIKQAHPIITNIKTSMQLWTAGGMDADYQKTGADYSTAIKSLIASQQGINKKVGGTDQKMEIARLEPGVKVGWQ